MQVQSFKNHRRFSQGYHFIVLPLLLVVFAGAVKNLMNASLENTLAALLLLALTIAVILLAFLARGFALRAQDRAIRNEQNFRHYIATGKPLDAALRMGQIIALRFAGDDEFVALAKKAADENMPSKEIKLAIKSWKADHHRV